MMNGPDDFVGPVNLGNPTEFTILDLAEKTIKLTGSKSKIIFKPLPQDDPLQRRPDITLAKERLRQVDVLLQTIPDVNASDSDKLLWMAQFNALLQPVTE